MSREVYIVRFLAGVLAAVCLPAQAGDTSRPAFVFLRPETSSFWNTATNSMLTLPVEFPYGATKATLSVVGLKYSMAYSNIVANTFELTLPAATSPATENVYTLALEFDNGVACTAKLGLVQGKLPDAQGATRCIAPMTAATWRRVKGRAVLPIPYGMTSFTVDGVVVDPGLGGAQGWYVFGPLKSQSTANLALATDYDVWHATLYGIGGFLLEVK